MRYPQTWHKLHPVLTWSIASMKRLQWTEQVLVGFRSHCGAHSSAPRSSLVTSNFGSQHRLSQTTSSPAKGKQLEITLQLSPGDLKLSTKGRSSPKDFKPTEQVAGFRPHQSTQLTKKNDMPEKNQSPAETNSSLRDSSCTSAHLL